MKKAILGLSLIVGSIFLGGCDNPQDLYTNVGAPQTNRTEIIQDTGRFDLRKVQTFFDKDSYSSTRSVYILKDKQTGKEFIGISGIGISELGSHTSGKSTIADER